MIPTRTRGPIALAVAACLLAAAGCGDDDKPAPTSPPASPGESAAKLTITSTAFAAGQPVPKKYTGDGEDKSPPLSWSGVPAAAKELALIVDDPDAPTDEPWVHWVIYKIPASAKGLAEGDPAGAPQGKNSFDNVGYGGPSPPPGHGTHHYHFKLYALGAPLAVQGGLDKKALLSAMSGHIIAQGELIGTYERK